MIKWIALYFVIGLIVAAVYTVYSYRECSDRLTTEEYINSSFNPLAFWMLIFLWPFVVAVCVVMYCGIFVSFFFGSLTIGVYKLLFERRK